MQTVVSYMRPDIDRPEIYLFEPPPGVAKQYATVAHSLRVADGRKDTSQFSLDDQGFVLRQDRASVVSDFYDEGLIRTEYYARMTVLTAQ